jgi:hypothetical protein
MPPLGAVDDVPVDGAVDDVPVDGAVDDVPVDGAVDDVPVEGAADDGVPPPELEDEQAARPSAAAVAAAERIRVRRVRLTGNM